MTERCGRPVRGRVFADAGEGVPTDASGVARIGDVPCGTLRLTADGSVAATAGLAIWGTNKRPEPSDAELLGRVFFTRRDVTVEAGRPLSVTLVAQPACYVRADLRLLGGDEWGTGYGIVLDDPEPWSSGYETRSDRGAGGPRRLLGPLAAGPHTLVLTHEAKGARTRRYLEAARVTVDLAPERVAQVTLEEKPLAEQRAPRIAWLDGTSLEGRVRMSDGAPALGAVAYVFEPGPSLRPSRARLADATGALVCSADGCTELDPLPPEPAGTPPFPVALAFLPGRTGATLLRLPEGDALLRLTLPPPLSLRGAVTAALSLDVTPEPDGTFDLRGLTPAQPGWRSGRYVVQASLEGIWVSRSVEVEVRPGAPLPGLRLDVPLPSRPVILRLVDASGAPLVGAEVHVARPPGPITDESGGGDARADGAGALDVSWLEAGRHVLRVAGRRAVEVELAPLEPANLRVAVEERRVVVEDAGR